MARNIDKNKAISLRKKGYSYSQIKEKIKVSKSTLSLWLRNFPLSEERIRALRDNNQVRIEHCRNTKEANRKKRLEAIYQSVGGDIDRLSEREIKLCGLFLYWAEGTKSRGGPVVISNTDPSMIKFFFKFLLLNDIPKEKIFVRLQLYRDMDQGREIRFWSNTLGVKEINFKRCYIKKSNITDITYKTGFGHGTCSLMVGDVNLYNRIISSIKYIKDSLC